MKSFFYWLFINFFIFIPIHSQEYRKKGFFEEKKDFHLQGTWLFIELKKNIDSIQELERQQFDWQIANLPVEPTKISKNNRERFYWLKKDFYLEAAPEIPLGLLIREVMIADRVYINGTFIRRDWRIST